MEALWGCFIGGSGDRAGDRTLDLLIKSQLLYQLSYAIIFECIQNSMEENPKILQQHMDFTGKRQAFLSLNSLLIYFENLSASISAT